MRARVASIWLLITVAALLTPRPATGDDFPTALRQLKGLNSVAEAGLAFDEYQRRVLDAKIIIDRYLGRADAQPQRQAAVRRAIGFYVTAASAWRYSLTGSGSPTSGADCPPAAAYIARAGDIERTQHERAAAKIDRSPVGNDLGEMSRRLDALRDVAKERGTVAQVAREAHRNVVPLYWQCASEWTRTAETGIEPRWPDFSVVATPPPTTPAPPSKVERDAAQQRERIEGTTGAKCQTKTYGGGAAVTVCE